MKYMLIDAFTDKPFSGNPAAVCIVEKDLADSTMASIAREMNLSETAFVRREGDVFRLRWFTPKIEIKLCGHATLASARALRELGMADGNGVSFETLSGRLIARYDGELIELDFPVLEARESTPPTGLERALRLEGASIQWCGVNDHHNWIIRLATEEAVRALEPDRGLTMALSAHGIIVTARSRDYDFVSRFFAPEAGIFEDPVTGSAHCALTPYWAHELGKTNMGAYQASERGGFLRVELVSDRVKIAGKSCVVAQGEFVF